MATKSRPFSMRLSAEFDALVTEEARRTRRSKGAVVEALAEEALRMRMFPGIAFRGQDWDRRPWVMGTAHDVWQIVRAYQDVGSVEEMAAEGNLTERQIRLALAYYQRFPEDIDAAIADDRRSIDELRALYPEIPMHFV
jgi:uncharacterized protein (DUF433 family)